MRFLTVILTFLLALTACAAPANPTVAPEEVSKPGSDVPTLNGTFETSLSSPMERIQAMYSTRSILPARLPCPATRPSRSATHPSMHSRPTGASLP
jgi:hypothetical protein